MPVPEVEGFPAIFVLWAVQRGEARGGIMAYSGQPDDVKRPRRPLIITHVLCHSQQQVSDILLEVIDGDLAVRPIFAAMQAPNM